MTRPGLVVVDALTLGGQPALMAAPAAAGDAALPIVVVYHGFTRSKELDSHLAVALAQAGLRAVMPEADGHGERHDGDDAARVRRFWSIVRSSIDELPALRADLRLRGLLALDPQGQDRLGVAGLSMGGFIALGCLALHTGLHAGVSWMGSGHYLDLARTLYPPLGRYDAATAAAHEAAMAPLAALDPCRSLHQLGATPLLLWHGVRDEIVPFTESARLHAEMVRQGVAGRLQFVADPLATHKLNVPAVAAGVDFLKGHL